MSNKYLDGDGFAKLWERTLSVFPKMQTGKIQQINLPSYVDDVIVGMTSSANGKVVTFYDEYLKPLTPEPGKIYVDQYTNKTYRYNNTIGEYVEISASIALGSSTGNAYYSNLGVELEKLLETLTLEKKYIQMVMDNL